MPSCIITCSSPTPAVRNALVHHLQRALSQVKALQAGERGQHSEEAPGMQPPGLKLGRLLAPLSGGQRVEVQQAASRPQGQGKGRWRQKGSRYVWRRNSGEGGRRVRREGAAAEDEAPER